MKKDSLDYRGRHRASAKRPATLFASNVWTHAPLGSETGNLDPAVPSLESRIIDNPEVGNSGADSSATRQPCP